MQSTYITLDDSGVTLECTRPGRIFSLDGKESNPDYPIPHTIHSDGCQIEPRMSSVCAPPPYHQWMYTQDPLLPDTKGRISSSNQRTIPARTACYLMDLFGHGSLESLAFQVDHPAILENMDGRCAQPEHPHAIHSRIRRINIRQKNSGALKSVLQVSAAPSPPGFQVLINNLIPFASRLIDRLKSASAENVSPAGPGLEGRLKWA